jgi:hypothetical protein
MITIEEYKNIVKTEPNDKEFKPFNHRVYIYRGILIDYNYDVPDVTHDTFEPYFDEGYVRMVGDKIDYIRPHVVLDFKNDVQKYKDEIIKFIDSKRDSD